jgi:hypothetical protein
MPNVKVQRSNETQNPNKKIPPFGPLLLIWHLDFDI